jgi:hypothetical protein
MGSVELNAVLLSLLGTRLATAIYDRPHNFSKRLKATTKFRLIDQRSCSSCRLAMNDSQPSI